MIHADSIPMTLLLFLKFQNFYLICYNYLKYRSYVYRYLVLLYC
jgi:hypothetical protein